jgi:hypothetical protein
MVGCTDTVVERTKGVPDVFFTILTWFTAFLSSVLRVTSVRSCLHLSKTIHQQRNPTDIASLYSNTAAMDSSICSDPSSMAFLEGLPDKTPQYRFVNGPDLERKLAVHRQDLSNKKTTNQFVVFLNIPHRAVCRISDDSSSICHNRIFFDHRAKTFIIKMPTYVHDRAVVVFSNLFHTKISTMGLSRILISVLTADESYNAVTKQPDNQWGLSPTQPHTFDPSLVLEVGYLESSSKLASDARWWLESRDSLVELVITIKVDQTTPTVIVQKWELSTQLLHHPRQTTRANPPHAIITGEVSILRQNHNTVVNGTIMLPFAKMFRRPANPSQPQEQDVTFTIQDLEELAEETWKIQGLMW